MGGGTGEVGEPLSSQLLGLAQVYFQLELALNQIGIYCMLFSNNSFCI